MPDKKFEEPDVSPMDDYILDSIIEEEVEFALWMQDRRLKTEVKRALNSCGMSEGGTFVKGNSCAGTKGAGKKKGLTGKAKEKVLQDFQDGKITVSQVADLLLPPESRASYKKPKTALPFVPNVDPNLVGLSKGQKKFFGASKARGADGKLLTLYHGTDQKFDAFDNPNGGWNMFSDSYDYSRTFAKGWGDVLEVHLDLKKPLDLRSLPRQRGDARNELLRLLKYKAELDEDSINYLEEYLPYHKDTFQIINNSRDLMIDILIDNGYDGIIFPDITVGTVGGPNNYQEIPATTYVAFVASQIKKASNQNPTKSKDMNRALNSCGMSEGGTFGKGNSCAGTKGKGKTKPTKTGKKPKKEKYTKQRWKTSLNAWMDGRKIDSSKFWDKAKGTVALPDMDTIEEIAAEQAAGKPDKETEKSYVEFKSHLISQYESLLDAGLVVKAWEGEGEPYKVSEEKPWVPSSNRMREMVEETGEFYFFMTEKGFGEEGATEGAHPFLQMSPVKTSDGKPMLYNDVFRVVHDAVAHLNGGFSFSTRGEMNAMLAHASTLPKDSWPALWAETFAQNAYYEVHKTYAEQTYYSSKFVGLIEELQKQGEKKLETARGLGVMTHSDEDGECGCNRKRRSRQARLRYYAKRFLANKSKPIERFTKSPMKKSKGKVGGCGNSGQGFVAGNTCAKGTAAGPVAGQKAAGKPSDKHPNTTKVFDAKTAKAFLGSKKLLNIEDYQKQVEKDIKKVTKLNDVFVVPLDKDGKISGEIVQIDHRMKKPDGTKYDVLGIGTGEYRLEVIPIANSPTRKKDIPQKLIKTPVRKDNLSVGKKYKKATKSMTAKQTAAFVQSFWKDLTKGEQEDARKYIQYKGEVQEQESYKKASAKLAKGKK